MNVLDQTDEAAQQIYQDLRDRIANSYRDNDFEALTGLIHLPYTVLSFGPVTVLENPTDLRKLFDGIRRYLSRTGITHYHRVCLVGRFTATDEIEAMHETRLLAGAQLVETPYPVKSVVRRFGDKWKVCESDNALEPDRGFGRIFQEHRANRGRRH